MKNLPKLSLSPKEGLGKFIKQNELKVQFKVETLRIIGEKEGLKTGKSAKLVEHLAH